MITTISCLEEANKNDLINVEINYINNTGASNTFALLFCASTAPHETCNIKQYTSPSFILGINETGTKYTQFLMPNELVSYVATIQKWNASTNAWITLNSKSCVTNVIPQEVADNTLLYAMSASVILNIIAGIYLITKK